MPMLVLCSKMFTIVAYIYKMLEDKLPKQWAYASHYPLPKSLFKLPYRVISIITKPPQVESSKCFEGWI